MSFLRILEQLAAGELSVEEAHSRLSLAGVAAVGDFARLDTGRHARKGVPEVVFAPGKTDEQLIHICGEMLERSGSCIVSSLGRDQRTALKDRFGDRFRAAGHEAPIAVLRKSGHEAPGAGGVVGLLSAGTADIPVAEQAAVMAEEMGSRVVRAYDVGVAGVHRLAEPLVEMVDSGVSVLVVAAGMEGALPSVVAGLVQVPVIGLPTSTGYGLGGQGITALLSMLQCCSPGLVVVNIDNGIGAGATAALIANGAASAGNDS